MNRRISAGRAAIPAILGSILLLSCWAAVSPVTADAAGFHSNSTPNFGDYYSQTNNVKLTSSNGHHLILNLYVNNPFGDFHLYVLLSDYGCNTCTQGETHQWDFPLSPDAFSYSSETKAWSLDTYDRIQPFGHLHLDMKQISQGTPQCSGQTLTNNSVKGSLTFATGAEGGSSWGSVGTKNKPVSFTTTATATYNNDCLANRLFPCFTGYHWTSPGLPVASAGKIVGSEYFQGWAPRLSNGKLGPEQIMFLRQVQLPHPLGAMRWDWDTDVAPPPTLDAGIGAFQIWTGKPGRGFITGASSLLYTGSSLSKNQSFCKQGNKTVTQREIDFSNPSWKDNLGTEGLTAWMHIGNSPSIPSESGNGAGLSYDFTK
ncbi:MAG TPA: hypothetical protein VFB34_13655 [Chloroflexota bacterium]|nr:hypothetical protein [Chloroflexota bacterium]